MRRSGLAFLQTPPRGVSGGGPGLPDLGASDLALLLMSCVNAVGISYAGINAQGYVSATTFMVLSNLNKFVVVAFGMLVLSEAHSWQAVVGVCVALSGGVWYARARAMSDGK